MEAITKYIVMNGYPPTIRELGEELGLKSSPIVSLMQTKLKEKGYVIWEKS